MALKKIGALWRKEKNNKKFFSGLIELIAGQKVRVIVMPFEPKKGEKLDDKSPAYTILLATDEKQKELPTAQVED
jgi:hypothetical protein